MLYYVLALLEPLMVLVAGCVASDTKKAPYETRQLTMPKAPTDGQPFEVVCVPRLLRRRYLHSFLASKYSSPFR